MQKRWRLRTHDAARTASLARSLNVSPVIAQILSARGVARPQDAEHFFDNRLALLRDPGELPGATAAAACLAAAIRAGRRIVVYGDYDADGMTAAAILFRCVRTLGGDVGVYVPNRIDEGYGLNAEALTKLAADGAQLVVTVDCGVASCAEAAAAAELGLELVITDHHTIGADLPVAAAIVHPQLPGTAYPFSGLCGAGVAFKVAWALCQEMCGATKVGERERRFLMQMLTLAAIGAVADVVPLLDENRVLVRHGLVALKEDPPLGLAKLIAAAKLGDKRSLGAEDIAFTLAPRLNAAGRLGQPLLAVELLTTDDEGRATRLADYLNELNGNRETLERSSFLAAHKQAKEQFDAENDSALVLAGAGWHPGVIGIVAGRLADRYHRPVVVLSLDELQVKSAVGSARGATGVNLYDALAACADHLEAFGGHAAAAGLTIQPNEIDAFRTAFCEHVAAERASGDCTPELWIDGETPLGVLSLDVVNQLEQLAPFGHGNPRPLLCAHRVHVDGEPKRLGGGGRHLSVTIAQQGARLRAMAFGAGDRFDEFTSGEPYSVAFRPVINEFRGRRTVEMHLVDWRASESETAEAADGQVGAAAR